MRYLIFRRFLLLLVTLIAFFANASAQDLVLGVLEKSGGHYAGEPNYRSVLVILEKKGDAWQPFRSNCEDANCWKRVASTYPSEVRWTIKTRWQECRTGGEPHAN